MLSKIHFKRIIHRDVHDAIKINDVKIIADKSQEFLLKSESNLSDQLMQQRELHFIPILLRQGLI